MTEIRIDNRPVAIGDTTFELVAYNPLADETADHTYDIDIDLSIPANAAALGHIGRLDRDLATAWGEYRSGAVLADGRTIISGRAYLLSIADGRAKVQIVAEDHARRYTEDDEDSDTAFASGNRRIDTLLADTALPDDKCLDVQTMGEWKYCTVLREMDGDSLPHVRHPQLLATLHAAFRVLGFTVSDCLSNNDFANNLYVVSNSQSDMWGDHLPPWSLAKLSREVEKMFNVCIFVNQDNMTVKVQSIVLSMTDNLDIEAFDDWELEVEDDGEGFNIYDNVRYDLPDSIFYKSADLDDAQNMAFSHIGIGYDVVLDSYPFAPFTHHSIWDVTDGGEVAGTFVMFGDDADDLANQALAVNLYPHIGSYEADNVIKLSIVPAEHAATYYLPASGTAYMNPFITPVVVGCDYEKPTPPVDQTNYSIINDGREEGDADNDQQMRVTGNFTLPFMICTAGIGSDWLGGRNSLLFSNNPETIFMLKPKSLTLDNLAREFRWGYNIETLRSRHRYKVRAQWPWTERLQQFRVRCRGKHFVIYSVKHTLTERGFDPVAEIEMYPIDD